MSLESVVKIVLVILVVAFLANLLYTHLGPMVEEAIGRMFSLGSV